MLSTPEFRQLATTVALCLLISNCLVSAQTRRRSPLTNTSSAVSARQIARQVLPSVVLITMEGGCFSSGFFITSELIATNRHILDCGKPVAVSVSGNRRSLPIISVWPDPQHDLALVKVAGSNVRPLPLSRRGWPVVGEDVYVAGNPEGLAGTLSRGIISSLRRGEGFIQFDAPVSHGSSGGPVIDGRGQVVGVTVASVSQGQNLNFAIPAHYLRALLEHARRIPPDITRTAETRRSPTSAPAALTHPLSPAISSWESNPDWALYLSPIIGDTVIKEELKALIDAGLSVNTRDTGGRTALHLAAMRGQAEVFRYLARKGALELNARDAEGRTPLMIAASLSDLNPLGGLTSPWERFWTELPCSSEGNKPTTRQGEELMQWFALWQAERLMVLFLLGAGADVNAVDKQGLTVLDYAAKEGLTDFEQLISRTGRLRDQSVCALKLTESPAMRSFRLGMSLREVTARFRHFPMPETDLCGRLTLDFNEGRGELSKLALKPQEFTGTSRIRLTFVDGHLAYLRVTYTRESGASNPQEFRAALSGSLALPSKWRVTGDGDNWDSAHIIGCDGFKVITGYLSGPYVELHDVEALRTLLQRKADEEVRQKRGREEEQERHKREFKP